MEQLDNKITRIHNFIYANEGLSNSETLNEFLKIFYCKILDEQNGNQLKKLLLRQEKIDYINLLYNKYLVRMSGLIENAEPLLLREDTIIYIFDEFKDISFSSLSIDLKGHLLQKIIDRSYRESRGQFFTPDPVVNFIVKMIDPKLGEFGCDPASGTGGFLFKAIEHITDNEGFYPENLENIHFYDISKSMIKFVAMRMMFEFTELNPKYFVKNSIIEDFDYSYDYVLSNPPFGTHGKIKDQSVLSKYFLANSNTGKKINSQVPDILFVEKIVRILKDNGRAAVILPDGDFENPSLEYFRKYLVENVKIEAVVSLPDGTFLPYGTGVKSSILFFSKKKPDESYSVFYGKISKLGYSFSKHSKTVYNSSGEIDEDYTSILQAYKSKNYSDKAFLVNISEIIKNNYILSENFYSPIYKRNIEKIKKGKYLRLKDLVEFNYTKEKIDKESQYEYIEIADINSFSSEIINSSTLMGEDLPSRASYRVRKDDILVATSGNSIGTKKHSKAIVTDTFVDSICTNGFTVMTSKGISNYFLLYFFNSDDFLNQVLKYKYGTAIPCIGRKDFENILVPIPNDSTMKKIIETFERAVTLREEAFQLMNSNFY